jgi:flagellar biosynthesis protein FlhF
MKIKRFVAKDIRTALVKIKEELGEEAVIMSNKKIPQGIELMAAIDYNQEEKSQPVSPNSEQEEKAQASQNTSINNDDYKTKAPRQNNKVSGFTHNEPEDSLSSLLKRKVQSSQNPTENVPSNESKPVDLSTKLTEEMEFEDDSTIEAQLKSFTQRLKNSTSEGFIEAPLPLTTSQVAQDDESLTRNSPEETVPESSQNTVTMDNQSLIQIKAEMSSIRSLLEHQMSGLMWQNLAQKDPQRAVLNDKLVGLGLTEIIAEQISGYVEEKENEQKAWQQSLSLLSEQLNTTKNDILNRGGVVALVGPTGVGKTTTAAKLAARFSQIHGKDEVVLISTDTYRIAGFEQLRQYGEMIGCPVELAKDSSELDALLQRYISKKLVLIDTAGMSQRDLRLSNHLSSLMSSTRVKVRNYLVLSAISQHQVMQENVEHFKKIPLSACIYTKLDESVSLGELLSISIQNGLPLAYLTDGQKVPEDIKMANTDKLVQLADNMANRFKSNEALFNSRRPLAASIASSLSS